MLHPNASVFCFNNRVFQASLFTVEIAKSKCADFLVHCILDKCYTECPTHLRAYTVPELPRRYSTAVLSKQLLFANFAVTLFHQVINILAHAHVTLLKNYFIGLYFNWRICDCVFQNEKRIFWDI